MFGAKDDGGDGPVYRGGGQLPEFAAAAEIAKGIKSMSTEDMKKTYGLYKVGTTGKGAAASKAAAEAARIVVATLALASEFEGQASGMQPRQRIGPGGADVDAFNGVPARAPVRITDHSSAAASCPPSPRSPVEGPASALTRLMP